MISEEKIQEMIQLLVEVYEPTAVYLFGSYAWGEPNEDSDLDFFVVISDDIKANWDYRHNKRMLVNMSEVYDVSMDILVNNQSDFLRRSQHPSTLQFKILKEGRQLYGTTVHGMAGIRS